MNWNRFGLLLPLVAVLVGAGPAPAQTSDPLGSAQVLIQGNQLTIYSDEQTTDADQTINVGERAVVRTCYGGPTVPCGSIPPDDPLIAGLKVMAELRGPELPQPIPMETVPGGAFFLPSFQQEGDYRLENVRLVNATSGLVIGEAVPSVAVLHVRRIVLASATVTTLSLADLQARGISLTQENFQAFNFAVGFAFGDEIVTIDLPVLYTGNGQVEPLEEPLVALEGLPEEVRHTVERWAPPQIRPFQLSFPEDTFLEEKEEELETLSFPMFGAIVLPGNVSFLNQFFDARLVVANGAPNGSGVTLENVYGALRLPTGNVLRIATTVPPVAVGQKLPVAREDLSRIIPAGDQGSAVWTVEGLVAGTHVLQMDVSGDLVRPGRDPLPVLSTAQAAVEVVDARFNLTFLHPDVVREGEQYTLYVTVTNLSRATQNLISVEIRDQHLTGAHKADPNDDFIRTIQTLEPGQAETLEYELVADLTGKVVATTFQSSSAAGEGTILLYTGVGELGIPLSPATLVLPRFSKRLATPHTPTDDFYKANVRLLGLAYSLAVAPAGMAPEGLPKVIPSDVEQRAIDLGEAGQRTFLQEELLESLAVLALDQLGNRHPLAEFDELRRRLEKGRMVATELGALFRHEQENRTLDAEDFFDHFVDTTSYAAPYLAATLLPTTFDPAPALEIRQTTTWGPTALVGTSDDPDAVRTLPFGELYAIHETISGPETVPFALVGHVAADATHRLVLRNDGDQEAAGRLLAVVPDLDGGYRRLDFGTVTVAPHTALTVEVGAALTSFPLVDPNGVPVDTPTVSTVTLPPFRLIGAVQDFGIYSTQPLVPDAANRYGNGLSYLFNRPPDPAAAQDPANYRIRSTFNGLDVRGEPVVNLESEKVGHGAYLQPSGRVVNVRYSSPLSALRDAFGKPLLDHQHELETWNLVDRRGNPLSANVPAPLIDPVMEHLGGLVAGRVLRGTGEGVEGARIQLIRVRGVESIAVDMVLDLVGETTTDAGGNFYFDFVEQPHWMPTVEDPFTLRAYVPAGADPLQPAEVEEVSSTIRHMNRLAYVNVALLGRGTVTGHLLDLETGQPVPDGSVMIASTLFNESQTQDVEADGSFVFAGVPVGPLTLTGRDEAGRRVYATIALAEPGDAVDVTLHLQGTTEPRMGTVSGIVFRQPKGDPAPPLEPIAGAQVMVYSGGQPIESGTTTEAGRFLFTEVPAGQVTVQAADWRISRTPAVVSAYLSGYETVEVELVIPEAETRTVVGVVYFHDPYDDELVPVAGAGVAVNGPGIFTYTAADGTYRLEGVPVQGAYEDLYQVTGVDFERHLQGVVTLPRITAASPPEIAAQAIVLERMRGGIDGVVKSPLGQPLGSVSVVVPPWGEKTTRSDGTFSFDRIGLGEWSVVAHVGDGLTEAKVGYIGETRTKIVFGGHRPFVDIRLRGSGVVRIHTKTGSATGIMSKIYYRPTYYSETEKSIRLRGKYLEETTDPSGYLELTLPVGPFEVVVYNPLHGIKEIRDEIEFPGQVLDLEIVFEDAATVRGTVVDVDGLTPLPNVPVTLETAHLLPQVQHADAQGNFQFELVPQGAFAVSAEAMVGTVERVGKVNGLITLGGQVVDVTVRMKAQGTVRGRVVEQVGGDLVPLANAQYYVIESGYPHRRLPAGGWYTTDANGRYEVAHVYAGRVRVVARHVTYPGRQGFATGQIDADWQVVEMADVVMMTSVGSVGVTVRNPDTGGPVADCQVQLSGASFTETTVSDVDGYAVFETLSLGTYSVYAFHAPTGRSGRVGNLKLVTDGGHLEGTVYLDQRGEIRGTLWDDEAKLQPVGGGIVELGGLTAGGYLTALASTSSASVDLGRFAFLGIPEGHFDLEAGTRGSNRRALAEVDLTETAPIIDVDLVLEPEGDVYFRLFEKLTGDVLEEINPNPESGGLYSVRLQQGLSYDYTQLEPAYPWPGHAYHFPRVLLSRSGSLETSELTGEQRRKAVTLSNFLGSGPLAGSGTLADPYRVVLHPKGVVRVGVKNSLGQPVAGANVTLVSGSARFPSVSGADGSVTFSPVPAGNLSATATSPLTGFGGLARGTLTWDDQVVELTITLAPAVAAHGIVYQPTPDDRDPGDPSALVPQAGAIVLFDDASGNPPRTLVTGEDGSYHFDALARGGFTVTAQSANGEAWASASGQLVGNDGDVNEIPPLVLDASPPRIVSIVPPPGHEWVPPNAVVEIVFSEPLLSSVLPHNQSSSSYFRVRDPDGALAPGTWDSSLDDLGQQVVTFVPSQHYQNLAVYSILITGGPGGVRDRAGRLLTSSGNVGSNFKTSDSIGPKVIGYQPDLDRPVDPEAALRFDFNEAVGAPDSALDGIGDDDVAELYWQQDDGQGGLSWQPYPVSMYLTRYNYSLTVEPYQGVQLNGDTRQRKIVLSKLADGYGNVMATWEKIYVVYDQNPPHVDALPYPPNAPDGQLSPGTTYVLTPQLSSLDGVTPGNPGGDLDRVDYFFSEPDAGTAPAYSATSYPFAYEFIGAYSGDGVEPRPFDVWCRAVDTSTNQSNVVLVEMEVLPNQEPTIGTVTAAALAPVAGTFYPGSTLRATVAGLGDDDGSQLTVSVELWRVGSGVIDATPGELFHRPASGDWADLAPPSFDFDLPATVPEGAELYFYATAIDPQGASVHGEGDHFTVADDATAPTIDSLVVKDAAGAVETLFHIGDELYVELRARDAETWVESVEVSFDRSDVFPSPQPATRVAGTENLYRTATLTVPPDVFSDAVAVEVTVSALDFGANTGTGTLTFQVAPEPDPTAPTVTWLTPWEGAAWPADYTAVIAPQDGVALLLRVHAADTNLDGEGNVVPGTIAAVKFRGPEPDGEGGLGLSDEVAGTLVAGTGGDGEGVYELLWHVPNQISAGTAIPFEVRVVDTGGKSAARQVRMEARPARRVYEGVSTAVLPGDQMLVPGGDPAGPVFLLDGTRLSVYPAEEALRSLPSVYLYAGGDDGSGTLVVRRSVLTAPEITSYASSILFYPLELAVGETLGVGAECAVDVSRRGLLGSTVSDSMVLPGETGAEARAGGSHGGAGWYGLASGNWTTGTLRQPGSVYGNVRDPYLPGGGGAGFDSRPGGNGGGVVRLEAGGALVRLVGDLRADGGDATSPSRAGGGGAGGAIRLVAGRLEGGGRVTANGGHGSYYSYTGGGGGGRIAVSYRELGADFDPAAQIEAFGGHNDANNPGYRSHWAGAGTIRIETLDPQTGDPLDDGALRIRNHAGLPAAVTPLPALGDGAVYAVDPVAGTVTLDVAGVRGDLTGERLVLALDDGTPAGIYPITAQARVADPAAPEGFRVVLTVAATEAELTDLQVLVDGGTPVLFHGRSRCAALSAEGRVRLTVADDLEIGATLNDRTALSLDAEARALLRGEGPEIVLTADPAAGTDLHLGTVITLSWTVDDPLGLAEVVETWTLDAEPTVRRYGDERLSAGRDAFTLTIAPDTAPGPVTYALDAADLGGRTVHADLTWTVLENAAPTATLTMADGAPTTVKAGYSTSVVVAAQDPEGLATVTLLATGPATQASQQVATSGSAQDVTFEVAVQATASGDEPVILQAVVADTSGVETPTGTVTIAVTPNEVPNVALALADGAPAAVKPAQTTSVSVHGDDPDNLATVQIQTSGPVTEPTQSADVGGLPSADVPFQLTILPDAAVGPFTVTATVTDRFGLAATATLDLEVIANELPTGVLAFAAGTPAEVWPGAAVTVVVDAEDVEGLSEAELFVTGPATVTAAVQPLAGTADQATFEVVVARTALATETVTVSAEVRDLAGGSWQPAAPLTLGVLADTGAPTVEVAGVGAVYHAGQTLEATITVSDEVGASQVDAAFDGETHPVSGDGPTYAFSTVVDTEIATARTTQFVVTATDYAGNQGSSEAIAVELRPDAEPTVIVVDVQPGTGVLAGTTIAVAVEAGDDVGLTTMTFDLSGPVSDHDVRTINALTAQETWSRTLPTTLAAGEELLLAIATGDTFGHTVTESVTFTIVPDEDPPAATIDLSPPAAGDLYTAGDVVDVTVTAVDNVEVTSISLTVDGVTTTSATSPLVYQWTTPGVAGTTVFPITAEATDPSSNLGTASRTVLVQPLDNAGIPNIAFDCPTTGAYLPSGYENLILQATATDDVGVAYVELFAGDDTVPFETLYPETGTPETFVATTSLPQTLPVVVGQDTVTYRARVWDSANNFAEAVIAVHVVETVDLDPAGGNDPGALADRFVVLPSGTLTLDGPWTFAGLIVLRDATITHSNSAPGSEQAVDLTVNGPVSIECGGAIDASARGYGAHTTHPGETLPGSRTGGSHMGQGGIYTSPAGSTYGSVCQPLENGAGGQSSSYGRRGGGVVSLVAERLIVDGTRGIRANGSFSGGGYDARGGAGGSVWLSVAGEISGSGVVQARGGTSANYNYGSGGGGAIAIEYGASSGRVLGNLWAWGGTHEREGGAGTICLKGPDALYGDLIVSNAGYAGEQTVLPALGRGIAQAGSLGPVLVTDRASAIPEYFVSHWVEITDGATGAVKGAWRIGSVDGLTVTLLPNLSESIAVEPGDGWQGVYLFDHGFIGDRARLTSADPVRFGATYEITGNLETEEINARDLVIREGAELTHPAGKSLVIDLTGDLLIETGGEIDLTGRGYGAHATYPNTGLPGTRSGGSHLGYGGIFSSPAGATYGSVYRPQEKGAGGQSGSYGRAGGGVVRIVAANVTLEGTAAIRANGINSGGGYDARGGAGGSVWITASGAITGTGTIQARGGSSANYYYGSGGGGAVAVEYGSISETILANLEAYGGTNDREGGAGTIYLRGPAAVYGDLIVTNATVDGEQTLLPALGGGTAQDGSGGAVLVTDRAQAIPEYFIGHWVEITDAISGTVKGTWRIDSVDGLTATLVPNFSESIAVEPGDGWQGVYLFDNALLGDHVHLISADPVRYGGTYEITGSVETERITAQNLVLRSGATLTHRADQSLHVELSGDLVLEPGAEINVTGKGYGAHTSHPGASLPGTYNGGSHLGYGGIYNTPPGETYGSVYRPQEKGAGGQSGSYGRRGGGVVRIVATNVTLAETAAIRANGDTTGGGYDARGGAGGSVWITAAGEISGAGLIQARGGSSANYNYGSGGGGAIAVEYGSSSGTVLANLQAYGGTHEREGGPGTIYLKGPGATYGDLIVTNVTVVGEKTVLPALGGGIAQDGSGGAVLVTDRTEDVPAWFVGHWVDLTDGTTGALKGTWRIGSVDGRTVTLVPNGAETFAVNPGDRWQGVYLFDNAVMGQNVHLTSDDPMRFAGTWEITGDLETEEITAHNLVLRSDATLSHHADQSLHVDLSGDLVLEAGAAIDVSGKGYPGHTSHPGASLPGTYSGGSHLGYGGIYNGPAGETYGSVHRPLEKGAGGQSSSYGRRGGGVVRIVATNVTLAETAAIRANGATSGGGYDARGGAGGSVWITASGEISGAGLIQARGGSSANYNYGSGGGGAIAVEYGASSGTVLDNLQAYGGTHEREGGPGTIYLKGPGATYGDLIVTNVTVVGEKTVLPALGRGTAQAGSAGAVLVTDRSEDVAPWFVGHWVEITDGATGAVKGTWRIAAVAGVTVTLAPNLAETIEVNPGDGWQGVYLFDNAVMGDNVHLLSSDPVRFAATYEVVGNAETFDEITAGHLVVRSAAKLSHHAGRSLRIELSGDLLVEAGGAIDVSGKGYAGHTSHPGAALPGTYSGGSHLGYGGIYNGPAGETYGSVYRPLEKGAGGQSGSYGRAGGGVVRIVATNVTVEDGGAIRANGSSSGGGYDARGGAGGSVRITASGEISGAGTIEARGGPSANYNYGSGGGGAIAIEYGASSGTVLDNLRAGGHSHVRPGGAGTVYLVGPAATWGDLIVDNEGTSGEATELPSLGNGTAQAGSAGAVLVTDRTASIPAYFVGHWVAVADGGGNPKGTWRIAAVDDLAVTLEPNGTETLSIAVGDSWQGLYRFDEANVQSGAVVISVDPIEATAGNLKAAVDDAWVGWNQERPEIDREAIAIATGAIAGSYRIDLAAGGAADPDGLGELRLSDGRNRMRTDLASGGGSLFWPGHPGQELDLTVVDAHPALRLGRQLRLPALPAGDWPGAVALPAATFDPPSIPPYDKGGRPHPPGGRLLAAGPNWVAVADRSVVVVDRITGEATELRASAETGPVVALAGAGDRLVVAWQRAFEVVQAMDPSSGAGARLTLPEGRTVVALAADDQEAILLTRAPAGDGEIAFTLWSLPLGANGEVLVEGSTFVLPAAGRPSYGLFLLPGRLHVVAAHGAPERADAVYSLRNSYPGEAVVATPEKQEIPGGAAYRPWAEGLIAFEGSAARLLSFAEGAGWSEVARLELGAEILDAAGAGRRAVFVLPGRVGLYDLSDPAMPRELGTAEGNAQRAVVVGEEILLWSPGFAAPAAVLEASDGGGFEPAVDGDGLALR